MNLLLSYAMASCRKQIPRLVKMGVRVMVDSGAFSAWNSGHPIDLDAYCQYCAVLEQDAPPWGYVALDVIGKQVETLANLAEMRKRGLRPIPVLTSDMAPELAPELVEQSGDPLGRLCVAGAVVHGSQWGLRRCVQVARALEQRGLVARLHGLGFTQGSSVLRVPAIASVDSSTFFLGGRFLQLQIFDGMQGIKRVAMHKHARLPFREWPSAAQSFFLRRGIDAKLIASDGFKGTAHLIGLVSVLEWLKAMAFFEGRGKDLFLAASMIQAWPAKALHCARDGWELDLDRWRELQDNPRGVDLVAALEESKARGLWKGEA